MSSVSVSQLSKSYSSIKALDNVSFDVPKGELFGIIGPDGAEDYTLPSPHHTDIAGQWQCRY